MRRLLLASLVAGASALAGVAAEAGVGTRVLHEDDFIKVWDMTLQPGETAPLHTHEYPYTFVVQSGSTMEVRGAAGEHLMTFTAQDGESLSFDLVGDELVSPDGKHRIHKTHSATNVGRGVFKEILIEKKQQLPAAAAAPAASEL